MSGSLVSTVTGKALEGLDHQLDAAANRARQRLDALRADRPQASTADLQARLDRRYTVLVTSTGVATGGSAAVPGGGSLSALAVSTWDFRAFLRLTAEYALATAELHGHHHLLDDPDLRGVFVRCILVGNSGVELVRQAGGRTGPHLGKQLTNAVPAETLRRLNRVLGQHFLTKYGTKRGVLVIGRIAPAGIGALIGGAGNAVIARGVVGTVHRALGADPSEAMAA